MISVLPVPAEQREQFCAEHPVCREFTCLYSAVERGEELGWFSVLEEENRLVIPQLRLKDGTAGSDLNEDERFVTELMIRSAASYAMNRFLPELACEESNMEAFLARMKFVPNTMGIYTIQIQNLLHPCSNC